MTEESTIIIYTDGACSGNPGPGGWGSVLLYNGHRREMSGGDAETTNNRMEMMAVIQALETLKRPCSVKIYTDSVYVMKGMTEWIEQWKKRNWKTAAKKPVKNVELWQRLEQATSRLTVSLSSSLQPVLPGLPPRGVSVQKAAWRPRLSGVWVK